MAYYKGMCEFCVHHSSTWLLSYGWCDKNNLPINHVKYEEGECVEKIPHITFKKEYPCEFIDEEKEK